MTNDGGPAFPVKAGMAIFTPKDSIDTVKDEIEKAIKKPYEGMSLRDYFAAAALGSIPNRTWDNTGNDIDIIKAWARCAYATADAMIAERSK